MSMFRNLIFNFNSLDLVMSKKNLQFDNCCDNFFNKLLLNKSSLNDISQGSFNKSLSQKLIHDRSYNFFNLRQYITCRRTIVSCCIIKHWTKPTNFYIAANYGKTLGQDTSEPLYGTGARTDMNNLSCRRDMTELLLKAA